MRKPVHPGLAVLALLNHDEVRPVQLENLHVHLLEWDKDDLRAAVAYLQEVIETPPPS